VPILRKRSAESRGGQWRHAQITCSRWVPPVITRQLIAPLELPVKQFAVNFQRMLSLLSVLSILRRHGGMPLQGVPGRGVSPGVCRPGCVGRERYGRGRPAFVANLCGKQHRENRGIRMADRVYSHPADHAGDRAVSLGLHPGGPMLKSEVGQTGQ